MPWPRNPNSVGRTAELAGLRERFVAGGITTPILTPVVPPDKLADAIDALAR